MKLPKKDSKMKVNFNTCVMVKPEKPTRNGFILFSELEQIEGNRYICMVRLYRPSENRSIPPHAAVEVFKSSLSKLLVHFYSAAGRLSPMDGGRLQINCNGEGVPFTEAEADATLDELKEFDHPQLVPCLDITVPLPQLPLVAVQITRFNCGGVCLGVRMSHLFMDGVSSSIFFNEWARVARGLPIENEPFYNEELPVAVGTELCPSALAPSRPVEFDPPPLLIGESSSWNEKKKATTKAILKLTKFQVETLKREANDHGHAGEFNFSRFQAISAHIRRCACKARGHRPEQPTRLNTSVDIRQRMQPPLPKTYIGNSILFVAAFDHAGDLITKPLSYAASRVREAIHKVTNEYVSATISFMRGLDDLSLLQDSTTVRNNGEEGGAFYGNPNIGITSWLTLRFNNLDFGWGGDMYMTIVYEEEDGDCLILPGLDEEGSVMVKICLQEAHMEAFKKFFYDDINSIS